jgi:hypothetical protein
MACFESYTCGYYYRMGRTMWRKQNQEKKISYALGLDTLNLVLWGHIPFNYHDSSTNKK